VYLIGGDTHTYTQQHQREQPATTYIHHLPTYSGSTINTCVASTKNNLPWW